VQEHGIQVYYKGNRLTNKQVKKYTKFPSKLLDVQVTSLPPSKPFSFKQNIEDKSMRELLSLLGFDQLIDHILIQTEKRRRMREVVFKYGLMVFLIGTRFE
jgi:hypothetical protein